MLPKGMMPAMGAAGRAAAVRKPVLADCIRLSGPILNFRGSFLRSAVATVENPSRFVAWAGRESGTLFMQRQLA